MREGAVRQVEELEVFQVAYALAMRIFPASRPFPPDERFALTSQIRRSSRSVCLNLSEAWAKRRYEAHFISKLTDCDGENAETETSLRFAHHCGYLVETDFNEMRDANRSVGRMLGAMLRHPAPFLVR